ncbi:MAG: 4Fe-4S binding protein [Deltaproteobacteria bacterium]|nr:4Fe-4S binding protein [Deltaproteobacteria bacterium]
MRLITIRRISQIFFVGLFLWFGIVATVGQEWWQLRGWPINWFLNADPLMALGTVLTTRTLPASFLWALVTAVLAIFLGRIFCGWVCPLGALNHFLSWLALRKRKFSERQAANRYHPGQKIKYYVLGFLAAAALMGSLQTGLVDPLPLIYRSVNLVVGPIANAGGRILAADSRYYSTIWIVGSIFFLVLGLNLIVPRFFCRFVCPLGALFGLLNRFNPWRMGKTEDICRNCHLCESVCQGACQPSGKIRTSECLVCLNCLDICPHGRMTFAPRASAAGEIAGPDLGRRHLVLAVGAGLVAAPMWRLSGLTAGNFDPGLVRPPGALNEKAFLARCTKCGQCLRICPTNVIQPAMWEAGWEGLWTPALNFRIGSSGCQLNCVACGHVCPTAAIRPLSLDEKLGRGRFAAQGPIRLGMAAVDRTRCLPWAVDRPCLVCQELCPVSPKAIFTKVAYEPIRGGQATIVTAAGSNLELDGLTAAGVDLASGDYFLRLASGGDQALWRVSGFSGARLTVTTGASNQDLPAKGQHVEIMVRLSRPYVDPAYCIGCGVCEHECPLAGLKAIRITSDNESRPRSRKTFVLTLTGTFGKNAP